MTVSFFPSSVFRDNSSFPPLPLLLLCPLCFQRTLVYDSLFLSIALHVLGFLYCPVCRYTTLPFFCNWSFFIDPTIATLRKDGFSQVTPPLLLVLYTKITSFFSLKPSADPLPVRPWLEGNELLLPWSPKRRRIRVSFTLPARASFLLLPYSPVCAICELLQLPNSAGDALFRS